MTGVTPIFGIHYPDNSTKANALGAGLAQMGGDIESALLAAEIPPVTNSSFLVAPSAAARDAYFGVPGTEPARLALQNSGAQVLRTDGGWTERYYATYNASTNPGGATPAGWYPVGGFLPLAYARRAAVQSIPTGVFTAVVADSTIRKGQITVTAAGVVTIGVPGVYEISLGSTWPNTSAAAVQKLSSVFLNGAQDDGAIWHSPPNGFSTPTRNILMSLNAGDVVDHRVYQASGGALNMPVSSTYPSTFSVKYLEPKQ